MHAADAEHLLLRTGFSPTRGEVRTLARLSRDAAIDAVLASARTTALGELPPWVGAAPPERGFRRDLDKEERALLRVLRKRQGQQLKEWWWGEMLRTPSPVTERMTLFWHGHFTSSLRQVRWPPLMARQNARLRKHALGSFAALLRAAVRDEAMTLYLDGQSNRRQHPNENLARELMELFTLGEGHYSEDDVREAARALTGWAIDRDTGHARMFRRRHDDGEKTILGQRGRFGPDELVDILLEHPRTAEHITEKLWREVVSPEPARASVVRIAAAFRGSGYQVRTLLRELLRTPEMWAERLTLVKSPVELLVGTARSSGQTVPLRRFVNLSRRLGQDVLEPPSVKGWDGGESWLTTSTLPVRAAVCQRAARALRDDRFLAPEWQLK
jgi:uncharacterized protein (DUF1800 family)